jgi:hypothetical protein
MNIRLDSNDLIVRGHQLYEQKLRSILEPHHTGRYVAIEPDTEHYFVADTSVEALQAARTALPDKLFYLARVGYRSAHKIGGRGLQ